MMSLSHDKQAVNSTFRYLDDILNINNIYYDNMVSPIYPSELLLNKANTSDIKVSKGAKIRNRYNQVPCFGACICSFLMILFQPKCMINMTVLILNCPFLIDDIPRSTSYGVYISQPITCARGSTYVAHFNTLNKLLTQLLKLGYQYHRLCKTFLNLSPVL